MAEPGPVCDLCGGKGFRSLCSSKQGELLQCETCGLVIAWPQPTAAERTALYGPQYFQQTDASGVGLDYFAFEQCWLDGSREKLRIMARYAQPGRLLDVGCAVGFFMRAAREMGWQVKGVELSPWAAGVAREKYGLDVVNSSFEEADLPAESFDAVTLWQVLEHCASPAAVMRKSLALLRSGGIVALEVPDVSCGAARRNLLTWEYVEPGEHLFHFSPDTLTQLLTSVGFRDVTVLRSGGTGLLSKRCRVVPVWAKRFVGRHYASLKWIKVLLRPLLPAGQFVTAIARKADG